MIFQGTATALITPFRNTGIDFDAYDRLLDYQLESGANAVVALGTTGEPATLDSKEKELVISRTTRRLKGKIPVIVGAGANSTATATEFAKRAEELGADALLIVTPYYNKCTQNGLYDHYASVASAVSLPIICYNVPSRTGVNMLPATFCRLARDVKNIVAVKEASGNMEQIAEYLAMLGGEADVYSGDDALTLPIMALGGKGVISVASNVCLKEVSAMTRMCLDGDFKGAAELQLRLLAMIKALFSEVNPIPVKYAAMLRGFGDGSVRLPLTRIEEKNALRIKELMSQYL